MEPSVLMNLTRGRIVHLLVTRGPATAREISSALSLNGVTVMRALELLADVGIVRVVDNASADFPPAYIVDSPQVHDEMAQVRHFFAPWL